MLIFSSSHRYYLPCVETFLSPDYEEYKFHFYKISFRCATNAPCDFLQDQFIYSPCASGLSLLPPANRPKKSSQSVTIEVKICYHRILNLTSQVGAPEYRPPKLDSDSAKRTRPFWCSSSSPRISDGIGRWTPSELRQRKTRILSGFWRY